MYHSREYSHNQSTHDERQKHKRLVYVESQITKMLSKYKKHQARQEKLLEEVQQKKESMHEQKMQKISQVPSFTVDSQVSTRNRSWKQKHTSEGSDDSFDVNHDTQSNFRRKFLLEEKHQKKYS